MLFYLDLVWNFKNIKGFFKMELKEKIIEATIKVFNEKSMKFTMDDIANELHVSKKTIYKVFEDKESMFLEVVDYIFSNIKKSEREVVENDSLSTLEKICAILAVMPDSYRKMDFRQMVIVMEKYPSIYAEVEKRLETGWEPTIELIERGKAEGLIRKDVPNALIKHIYEASLEKFLQTDILEELGITYTEGLQRVVDVILSGVMVKE